MLLTLVHKTTIEQNSLQSLAKWGIESMWLHMSLFSVAFWQHRLGRGESDYPVPVLQNKELCDQVVMTLDYMDLESRM